MAEQRTKNRDTASRIVTRIAADLNDRRGLHIDTLDPDILLEMLEKWKGIVEEEIARG